MVIYIIIVIITIIIIIIIIIVIFIIILRELEALFEIAWSQPRAAYSAFTKAYNFMRTIGSKTKGSFEDRLTIGSLKFDDRSIRIV